MVNRGFDRKENFTAFNYSNEDLVNITNIESIRQNIKIQQLKYIVHVARMHNHKGQFGKRWKEHIR